MTKREVFYNKVSQFFDSHFCLLILSALAFLGYAFNIESLTISLMSLFVVISLFNAKTLKTLLGFIVLLPLAVASKFSLNFTNIVIIIASLSVIALSFVYFVVVNFKSIKRNFTWGKLIGGLTFSTIGLLFVGITKTNYLSNVYYLVGAFIVVTVYMLCVNTKDYNYILKCVVVFTLIANFEISLNSYCGFLYSSSFLVINIFAICCLFILATDLFGNIVANLLSSVFVVFSFCYSNAVITIVTMIIYALSLLYFALKNKNKFYLCIVSVAICIGLLFTCNWCSNGQIFNTFINQIGTFNFSYNFSGFVGIAIAFGQGFTEFKISLISVVLSIGVVGIAFILVLVCQIFKRLFINFTYNKVYLLFALIGVFVCFLVMPISIFVFIISVVFISLLETEDLCFAIEPFYCKNWEQTKQKYISNQLTEKTFYERCLKRPFDIVLSLLALILLSPIFLIVFILSKISIGGKAIFTQYRPGKNGKVFKLYKFRSMNNKTDEKGNLLPDSERITRFGKIIRKLSVDELPQLINILKGDMSIIGPRPRLVKDMIFYDRSVLGAYAVRPGLTGPSQVTGGRSEGSWESIFEHDYAYVQQITFWQDIYVLIKTVLQVFSSDGSATGAAESKREYYYCDYALKTGKITQQQYDDGLKAAEEIIKSKGVVEYIDKLHKEENA